MNTSAKIETFEEKQARERQELDIKIGTTKKLFREIFKALGMDEIKEKRDEREYNAYLSASLGDTMINLSCGDYITGWDRVCISGSFPRDKKGQYIQCYRKKEDGSFGGSWEHPKIYVSIKKSPEKIASEILRRFMPEYAERLAEVLRIIKQNDAYEDKTNVNLKRLKKAQGMPGEKLTPHEEASKRIDIKFPISADGYGHAEVYGGSVKIELRSLTIEQAEKIIKSLK